MAGGSSSHAHQVLPFSVYVAVAAWLLVLTFVTVYISTLNFGALNLVVALAIAATKATLVALFFMHLKYDSKLYLVIFLFAVAFLAVFIIFTMFDTLTRDSIYELKAVPISEHVAMYDSLQVSGDHGTANDVVAGGDSIAVGSEEQH